MDTYRILANRFQVSLNDDAPTVDGDDGFDDVSGVQTLRFKDGDLLIETRETGEDIAVNTQTGNDQSQPFVSTSPDPGFFFGDWGVVWRAVSDDGSTTSIRGQFYDSGGAVPVGPTLEFAAVDSATGDLANPSIVIRGFDSNFLTWEALNQDGSGWGVFGRLFDDAGTPQSAPVQINTFTNFDQQSHATSRLFVGDNGGHMLTVWVSQGQDGPAGIYAQRIGGLGELVDRHGFGPGADEFRVDTDTAAINSNPAVATLRLSRVAVAWESEDVGTGVQTIMLRLYDPGLESIDVPFAVDPNSTGNQSNPVVLGPLSDPSSKFLVAWEEQGRDGDGSGIFARQFQVVENEFGIPTGAVALGDTFQVNETTEGDQRVPGIVENTQGGGFVFTWQSPDSGNDSSNTDIYARVFDPDGNAISGELKINAHGDGRQEAPVIGTLNSGKGFYVAWQSDGQDGDGLGIFAQQFDPDGNPVGLTVIRGTDANDVIHMSTSDEIAEGAGGDDTLSGNDGADTLDGGAGLDSVDYGHDNLFGGFAVVVDLGTGTGVDPFGDTDTLIGIERVIGTGVNDTLIGSDGADILRGGDGNDLLEGGAGTDTAEFAGSVGDYTIVGDVSAMTVTGPIYTDTLSGIERLRFDDGTFFPDPLPNAAPVLAVADLVGIAGVAAPAGDLADPSDPDGDQIGVWSFQDQTFGGGRFEISGLGDPVFEDGSLKFKDGDDTLVTVTGGVNADTADGLANELGTITVVADSLSHVTFAPGSAGNADTLAVQVEDELGLTGPWETLTFTTVSATLSNGYLSQVLASGSNRGSEFGASVALSADGQYAVVGAPDADLAGDDNQGAVYLYEWDGAAWTEQTLTLGTPAPGAGLGASVDISDEGTRVLAGAPGDLSAGDAGGAFVFDIAGGGSVTGPALPNEGGGAITGRGLSVALSADGATALVGAAQGSATVYETDPVTFQLNGSVLTSGDGGGGVALSADGTRAAVGSPNDDLPGSIDQGSVYVFDLVGGTWTEDARLVREMGTGLERFGETVAPMPACSRRRRPPTPSPRPAPMSSPLMTTRRLSGCPRWCSATTPMPAAARWN